MIPRRAIHTIDDELSILMSVRDKGSSLKFISDWEKIFSAYIGTKYAVAVSSGREGMRAILSALELKKGDEVIIPAYTLKDLARLINALGFIAVPADIDPEDFNIASESILKRISGRTRVILATHIFGTPCQLESISQIARDKGIVVIEDCAHAAGAEFKGQKVGSFGEAAFFSFETIKPVNTYGGGMVVTDNEELAIKIRRQAGSVKYGRQLPVKKLIFSRLEQALLPTPFSFIALYLLASGYWSDKIYALYRLGQRAGGGGNNLSGFQAQLGIGKIKTLGERISRRREQAGLYGRFLDGRIRFQREGKDSSSNFYFFVVMLPVEARPARRFLLNRGIDAGVNAEIADDCARGLGYNDCINTANTFRYAIQLPLHEGVCAGRIRYIANKLNQFINKI